ncbi:aldehyde dehydrogenase family protein [Dyadobacter chenwenxiniae]|uniref:Aldehyde dehydrogenase n=1 Tax=Dyadobacter chenwenxiniae TaxID=2906456 RepID=A0A9X1TGG3_9BACT|nr:aldehyde dehydrogenase family protein [Dyadobacter chenwenxiniae]MCF0065531.1 aldehyde dehydrogenase family protein [Dyadobacter chenwenxiniae]UON85443.1 aldehyde dehydrogenase family protein [Dyadobacter chenwenxiniae]
MYSIKEIFNRQKAYFLTEVSKTYEWRITQLENMERMLSENQAAFLEALKTDFKTCFSEQLFEVNAPLGIIQFVKSQLVQWMQPVEVPIPKFLATSGHKGIIYREPYGSTLVIGPYNGPLILLINPAIAALSAGNTVVMKANEQTPATSGLLESLIPQYFEPEVLALVNGGKEVSEELLSLPFDFIIFTGSSKTGKIVAKAAAEHLTPTILELGGQNPVIIDQTANVADAARKLVWAATGWGGQWCTSPGYVYIHESVADSFIEESKKALTEMYGDEIAANPDFSKMISISSVQRLVSLIDAEKVVAGGSHDELNRFMEPTIIYPVKWNDPIMDEEIFGPILPVLTYSELSDAVGNIKQKAKPLSAYIFSQDQDTINLLAETLSFGGGAVNQSNIHVFIVTLPFGGVGASGMGTYYGKPGFDALTHAKSILHAPTVNSVDFLIPPYTIEKLQALNLWFDY